MPRQTRCQHSWRPWAPAQMSRPAASVLSMVGQDTWRGTVGQTLEHLKQALTAPPALEYPRQTDTFNTVNKFCHYLIGDCCTLETALVAPVHSSGNTGPWNLELMNSMWYIDLVRPTKVQTLSQGNPSHWLL